MLKMNKIKLELINDTNIHLFIEKCVRGGISYIYIYDYPLCPEKIEITQDMLSKYCSEIADNYGIKVDGVRKLVPNLKDKVKYVVHYRNLQYYLSLGIKLIKVHRIL